MLLGKKSIDHPSGENNEYLYKQINNPWRYFSRDQSGGPTDLLTNKVVYQ